MKSLLALCALLLLSACSTPKVLFVVDNENYHAVFTDAKCTSKEVLEVIKQEAAMARLQGVPEERIQEINKSLRQGQVDLKQRNESRAFCYVMQGEDTAFVIDSTGGEGTIHLNTPKKD